MRRNIREIIPFVCYSVYIYIYIYVLVFKLVGYKMSGSVFLLSLLYILFWFEIYGWIIKGWALIVS
jgi:hypothetical protein